MNATCYASISERTYEVLNHPMEPSLSPAGPTRQRHICVVTETYSPEVNGVALTLSRLVEGLRLQGYAVSLVRPRQPAFDLCCSDKVSDETLVRGLPLPGYPGLRFGLPAGAVLRRRWAEHRPDVLYVATEGPLGCSAVRSAGALRIPVFSGFHTNFHSYSEHYHFGCLGSLIIRYLRAFHNRTAGTIVAGSELRDRLQAIGVDNVSILGRGVDNRMFNPKWRCPELRRQWGAPDDDALVALYVGRLAPEKNLALAIESYRAMRQTNRAVKFVLVGDGPERAALQRKHADLIFCGWQTGKELAQHYASADVFLFSSETETFGNVTLEAMASGLAVIAYDYAAARVHIRHGENGVLAAFGDARAFVDAAVQIARNPASLAKIRRQAADDAASADWQRVFSRFAALLLGAAGREQAVIGRVSAAPAEATASSLYRSYTDAPAHALSAKALD